MLPNGSKINYCGHQLLCSAVESSLKVSTSNFELILFIKILVDVEEVTKVHILFLFGLNEVRVKVSSTQEKQNQQCKVGEDLFPFFQQGRRTDSGRVLIHTRQNCQLSLRKKKFLLNFKQKILRLSTTKLRLIFSLRAVQKMFYFLITFLFLC